MPSQRPVTHRTRRATETRPMLRTKTLGELRAGDAGSTVTLAGWVHTRREHGNVTFIDLRDRYGITQIVAHATEQAAAHAVLKDVRNEWVIQVKGQVRARKKGGRFLFTR